MAYTLKYVFYRLNACLLNIIGMLYYGLSLKIENLCKSNKIAREMAEDIKRPVIYVLNIVCPV